MKIYVPIICLVLFVLSLFGVIKAFSLPAQISTSREVSVMDYQQQGKLDYHVTVKPSHLYGPDPAAPAPPLPEVMKYPIDGISSIGLTFAYSFSPDRPIPQDASEYIEIKGVVRQTGQSETKTVVLLPRDHYTGNAQVTVPLALADDSGDSFLDFSNNVTGNEMIITAYVYTTFQADSGPVFESFTQSLPLTARGPILEVNGELTHSETANIGDFNYEQRGQFSYQVHLKSGFPYGGIVLDSPSLPSPAPPPTLTELGPNDIVINSQIVGMDMDFTYNMVSDKSLKNLQETVSVQAILENPGKWSKSFELVPSQSQNGRFTVSFPVDLAQFTEFFKTIQDEIGGGLNNRNLTIKASIHAKADTDFSPINTDFTLSATTDLAADTLTWSDNLTKTEPGQIKTKQIMSQANKFLRMPVSQARIVFLIIMVILLGASGYTVFRYLSKRNKYYTALQKVTEVHNKYKGIIIEAKEIPEIKPGEAIVQLDSLNDLAKTAENLMKPLLHQFNGQAHVYYVFDASVRYVYRPQ
jgi:hypothetical protein